MMGDANCSGYLSSGDIVVLTSVVYRGGNMWCDVCNLWADGRWRCPVLEW